MNFSTHGTMIFKKRSQLLIRKLKRKVKDSVKYKSESECYYPSLDYFLMKENQNHKCNKMKELLFVVGTH